MIYFLRTLAAKVDPTQIGYNNPIKDSSTALDNLLNLVYMWGAILAVLIIIIAGYLFMTARGDPAQIKRGKDALRGAVIGLVIILLAFTITQIVLGRF